MMLGFVQVFSSYGVAISEKKTEVISMSTPRVPVEKMRAEAAGQRYCQADFFVYLVGNASDTPDVSTKISRRNRTCGMCVKKYAVQLYGRPTVPLDLKTRKVKAEAAEALSSRSVTRTLRK